MTKAFPAHRAFCNGIYALLTALLLFSLRVNSQSTPTAENGLPFITNYSAKTYNALPQTWSIEEDNDGIKYFGIQNCILQYDGVRWKKIILSVNVNSTVVRSMTKSKEGRIYYGAISDIGYLKTDSLGQTKLISMLDVIPESKRNFFDIWSSYSDNENVYFQSREYIFRVNTKDDKKTAKVWSPQTKFMYAFCLDGNYFVQQQGLGLFKLENDSLVFVPGSEFLGKERIQVMLPYTNSNNEKQYLLGMFFSGLYTYDGKTFQPFKTEADAILKSGTILYKGLQLKNGNYVLATTGKGLIIIDKNGKLVQQINRSVGLQDESVYAIYEDKKGALWLGLDNGISRVETSSPVTKFGLQSGITTGVINIKRHQGVLYIGTTNGLLKLNNETSSFDPIPGIPLNQIFNFIPNGSELLVAGEGLFSLKNNAVTTVRSSVSGDLSLVNLLITKKNPRILLAGCQSGIAVFYNTGTENQSKWEFEGYIPELADQIWTFAENKDGSIWAGTQSNLLYLITIPQYANEKPDVKNIKFEKYGREQGYKNGIGAVYSIKGTSYFEGDTCIYTFDAAKKTFTVDTTFGRFKNGGGDNEFDMVEDPMGRVWIRMGKTTRLAIPKPEGGYRFDDSPLNMISDLFFQRIYVEKNGVVWICTTDGLIRYNEASEIKKDQSYKTIINQVSSGKQLQPINNPGKNEIIKIASSSGTLRFEYAAPFFDQEEKTQYQTWLEGFEKDWSEFGSNSYKEYTNLPSGVYHFHVRAKNVYTNISDEAVYTFEILPPWYNTWWAYTLYALASLGLIYIVIRWRTRQLQEKHKELEKVVDERTKELSHRVKELAVINSVQDALVRKLDFKGIYEMVGEKIREIFKAEVIDIVGYDKTTNMVEDKYSYEKGDKTLLPPRELKGFRKHIVQTGEPLLLNSNLEQLSREYDNQVLYGEVAKSAVFVPLIDGAKEVIGIISLQDMDKENGFTQSDLSLLKTLANSMSVALESARLFDETKRLLKETEQRNAELAVINNVQESLVAQIDIQGIYNLVGEKMREIFNAQAIDIVTYDNQTGLIEDKYSYEKGDRTLLGSRPAKGFRKHVIDTGSTLKIDRDVEKERAVYDNTVLFGDAAKSLVMVPMFNNNEVAGIISLQNLDKEEAFSESDVSLLTTLVNSMSVALKSARLFDETTRLLKETELRQEELSTINSVQEGLVKEVKSEAIYELVGEKLCSLFNSESVVIRTFDHEKGLETWQYAIEKGERQYADPKPFIWANKQLIKTLQPLFINENYVETAQKYGGTGVSMGQAPKSAVFVPMINSGVVRGSVSLQNIDKENAFSEADLRLITTITNSMGVALENARLFDETTRLLEESKQRAAELSTVNNISKALTSKLDTEDLIKMVGDQLKDLFKANIVYLALLNPKTKTITFPYQYGDVMAPIKLGEGLTSKIILKGEPLLINKDLQEHREQLGIQKIGIPAASYLGVPIPVGEENIGVLSVQSTEQENRFNENDLRLLTTIASSVGVALNNAKLFEEVKLAKMEAETASKVAEKANEAKSAFLSTVSHELRTPLTSVLGFAKIIKKRLEEKIFPGIDKKDTKVDKVVTQVSENLKVVISEGERLTTLINDVLDLAKIEAGKMEWNQENVSIPEVAERAIAATTALFEQKNLKLIRQIDSNIPEITGDRDKLIQVIINLISNSVKFTDHGSITCRVRQENNDVVVSITDTGIGIAKEDFAAVFEQFKQVGGDTLTDKPKGTGLGLPICKEIIEHHGGRIWLESEVGKGSTFSFSLPVVTKTETAKPLHLNDLVKQLKEQMAQSAFKLQDKTSTILVVDDDDSIRSLLHQELSDAGYLIEEAANGKQALECVRRNKPDLIILDVMMPEMNGFDVAAVLKNDPHTMDIPIIVLSIVQDKARGFRIGVDRYLTKPIDTGQLFEEVGILLEQGKSKKKVMVVDEDSAAVKALTDVLHTKGYVVVESDGKELVEKAISSQPDIIILNSIYSDKQELVQTLRFEKGLENVLFLIYQ